MATTLALSHLIRCPLLISFCKTLAGRTLRPRQLFQNCFSNHIEAIKSRCLIVHFIARQAPSSDGRNILQGSSSSSSAHDNNFISCEFYSKTRALCVEQTCGGPKSNWEENGASERLSSLSTIQERKLALADQGRVRVLGDWSDLIKKKDTRFWEN